MIQPEFLQTRIQRRGNIGHVLVHLGGDEQLVSREVAFGNSLAELGLGTVDFSAVEVVISQLHGSLGRVHQLAIDVGVGLFVPCCASAIAELGERVGVNIFNGETDYARKKRRAGCRRRGMNANYLLRGLRTHR